MNDVSAKGVTYTVVSAKKPGEFIVRGIKKWSTPESVRNQMQKYVAIVDPDELEWTFHNYFVPHYMEYGSGDIPARFVATDGIYIHRFVGVQTCDAYGPGRKIEAW